jgi:hypothetical protein
MTIRSRLKKLEDATRWKTEKVPYGDHLTEEDWFKVFEELGNKGNFAGEPDFPDALATYRLDLNNVLAQTDPPFEPPAAFMPYLDQPMWLSNWRDESRFPHIWKGWEWLAEMLGRIHKGIPPVTVAEFNALSEWFGQKDSLIYHQVSKEGLIDLGNGKNTSTANIRSGLTKGPRVNGAGELAETLRRLRCYKTNSQ